MVNLPLNVIFTFKFQSKGRSLSVKIIGTRISKYTHVRSSLAPNRKYYNTTVIFLLTVVSNVNKHPVLLYHMWHTNCCVGCALNC